MFWQAYNHKNYDLRNHSSYGYKKCIWLIMLDSAKQKREQILLKLTLSFLVNFILQL